MVFPTPTAASVFGALGVSGVAIGFAFKATVPHRVATRLPTIRPFRIGDQIVSGGHEGTVEDIPVRATRLRTRDNRRVVVPKRGQSTNRVIVNTAYDQRRLAVTVGIGSGDDTARAQPSILKTPAGAGDVPALAMLVRALAAFRVHLEVRSWTDPPIRRDVVELQDRVLPALHPALIAAGIDLPLPHQRVLVDDQTEEMDGDRARQRGGRSSQEAGSRSRAALHHPVETP